ncbi:RICIN domain-containing protein [Streptomyces sp. NRRL F-5630]|uniref:RICIN domain-containing protein n=1 Tax=Streptomyces sp. NRRL F-5630 TaxID=1463864 RepID=UPI003EBB85DD
MAPQHDPSDRIPPRSGTSADAGASGKPGSSPVSVRRAVTMGGAAGDPGGALAPGGALTPGGGQRGRTHASPAEATPDAHARTERSGPKGDGPKGDGPKGDGPENKGPEHDEPENKGPENKDARKKATEPTDADGVTGAARGIGAPKPSAAAPAGTKAADRAATQAAVQAAAKGGAGPAASAPDSSASSASASSASVSSATASSASPSAPTTVLATVGSAGGSAPDAVAAAAAGSGGAGTSTRAGDEPPGSRPKKPMLAAAAIVGAILIAVPFLVAGQDEREPERTRTQNAADTVLDTERSAVPDTYTSESPTPSPKPSKEKKEKPPAPVVHKQTFAPSPSASEKPKEKPKPKPKPKVKELTAAEKLRQWANGRSGVQNTVIKNADTGQCIDIGGYDKGKINDPVNQFPCNDTTVDNQLWNLDIVDKNGGPQNAPLFLIRNSKDGLCLDLGYYNARSAGTKVSEFHCNATGDNQLWWLDPRGDGTNWIRNAVSNDLCLRPTDGASAGNDARLEIAMCGFGDRWIV